MSCDPIFYLAATGHSTAVMSYKHPDIRKRGWFIDRDESLQDEKYKSGSEDEGRGVLLLLSDAGDSDRDGK